MQSVTSSAAQPGPLTLISEESFLERMTQASDWLQEKWTVSIEGTPNSLAMRAERLNPGLVEFDLTATTEDCVWDAQVKLINRAYNENWRSLFAVQEVVADIDKEEAKSLLHRLRPIATAGGIKPEGISPQEVAQHFARWTLSDMSDALALFRAANAKTIHPDDATVMSKTIPGMTPEKRELSYACLAVEFAFANGLGAVTGNCNLELARMAAVGKLQEAMDQARTAGN